MPDSLPPAALCVIWPYATQLLLGPYLTLLTQRVKMRQNSRDRP